MSLFVKFYVTSKYICIYAVLCKYATIINGIYQFAYFVCGSQARKHLIFAVAAYKFIVVKIMCNKIYKYIHIWVSEILMKFAFVLHYQ